ncbi:MAG: Acetyl-coenzyme A carboxylase carboxyl transferase subunit alpha [Chlamydiae bacterium]|nr:Acetyl-coenzyme A carboxylase carboxyl transferase subunit alpha [Chlamydiota bacterium]
MTRKTILPHEIEIMEYEQAIGQMQEQKVWDPEDLKRLQDKLILLRKKAYSKLSAWERVQISRHPNRPKAKDYLEALFTDFVELFGDRTFGDDHAIITGLGKLNGIKCAIVAQEKGEDTEARVYRNFGMAHPEGFRKAKRVMQLAEKFDLPIITFIDTPGAYPGLSAEERGQGCAIAENLYAMAKLQVPIICVIIGEGCSGGALAIGMGNSVGMLENAYYSVISPEGCASILYKDANKKDVAAKKLKLLAEDLIQFNVIDEIIKEPIGGAHLDAKLTFENTKTFLLATIEKFSKLSKEALVEQRYQKYRNIGVYQS